MCGSGNLYLKNPRGARIKIPERRSIPGTIWTVCAHCDEGLRIAIAFATLVEAFTGMPDSILLVRERCCGALVSLGRQFCEKTRLRDYQLNCSIGRRRKSGRFIVLDRSRVKCQGAQQKVLSLRACRCMPMKNPTSPVLFALEMHCPHRISGPASGKQRRLWMPADRRYILALELTEDEQPLALTGW